MIHFQPPHLSVYPPVLFLLDLEQKLIFHCLFHPVPDNDTHSSDAGQPLSLRREEVRERERVSE